MTENKISEPIKELLKSGDFVLWCLTPTPELDNKWRKWAENNPHRSDDLIKARQILQSAKLNQYKLTPGESKAIYAHISERLNKRKKQKTIRLIVGVAACIAILCTMAIRSTFQKNEIAPDEALASMDIKIDSIQTEIELELSGSKKMQIDNKAIIQLSTQGTIQITGNQQASASPSVKEEEKPLVGSQMNVLKVPNGRHSSLVLADGTKVWVNSGTVLSFPSTFEADNRTISVNGEIYLEVAKDASRPFYVKTSQMDVRVLGTAFNVTAYKQEKAQSVVLSEGSVEVTSIAGQTRQMQPEEMLVLEDNKLNVSHVEVYDYISWKDGILQFDGKKMEYVIQRLSRYYGVEFDCSQNIRNYVCSGKLVLFDDIASVMITLKESFPISYEIVGDKIKLSSNPKTQQPM